jgi:hypothetical protein
MSSSTRRQQQERDNEYSSSNTQQQHEATIRSIDMTKDNIRRSIEEVRRETPRYSQTVTDFQNEAADASVEIADNFLESQKEVINSMQSGWTPMAERIGQAAHYWTTTGMMMPFFSPREMADIYARTIGAMAEAYVASTRMATNMLFAGLEATRATTNYTRQNAKEASRITSNTARAFAQTARETVQVQGEDEQRGGGISVGGGSSSGFSGGAGGGAATTTTARTTYTSEGATGTSGTGTGSTTTTTTGTINLSDTVPGVTEKNRKK